MGQFIKWENEKWLITPNNGEHDVRPYSVLLLSTKEMEALRVSLGFTSVIYSGNICEFLKHSKVAF